MHHVLRAVAFLIAIAAVVDPAVTTERTSRPVVAVIGDNALADAAEDAIASDFTVVREAFDGAAANVVAGGAPQPESTVPGFGVSADAPYAAIVKIVSPQRAHLDARVPVEATLYVHGAVAEDVHVALTLDGVAVDRATVRAASDDERIHVPLGFVPADTGAAVLRITATLANTAAAAAAVIDIHDERAAVLFFDPRPSWLSTFVRRALQRDAHFDVASRIITSRDLTTSTGAAPASLADIPAGVAVLMLGAPELLRDGDVVSIEAFLRRRGASVVLLPDHYAAGPWERLVPAEWTTGRTPAAVSITMPGDAAALRASEFLRPRAALAAGDIVGTDSAGGGVVWRFSVGAGKLWVSGALDTWRFRTTSEFDSFWQTLIGRAAAESAPAIGITAARPVARPGEAVELDVTLRAAALNENTGATVQATFRDRPVRIWPTGMPGSMRVVVRAPHTPGTYRLRVSTVDAHAELPIVVDTGSVFALTQNVASLNAWASSRGGAVVTESRLDELSGLLHDAIRPALANVTWHPMRSAWWILPFSLALSAEWWLRRRRGLL